MKLAYADLHRYNADPRFAEVPVSTLISKEFARKRASLISPEKANCNVGPGQVMRGDTTYLTVVDKVTSPVGFKVWRTISVPAGRFRGAAGDMQGITLGANATGCPNFRSRFNFVPRSVRGALENQAREDSEDSIK